MYYFCITCKVIRFHESVNCDYYYYGYNKLVFFKITLPVIDIFKGVKSAEINRIIDDSKHEFKDAYFQRQTLEFF